MESDRSSGSTKPRQSETPPGDDATYVQAEHRTQESSQSGQSSPAATDPMETDGAISVRSSPQEQMFLLSIWRRSGTRPWRPCSWSHHLLPDVERFVLRRVGIFAGSFSLGSPWSGV